MRGQTDPAAAGRSLAYLYGIGIERVKWLGGARAETLRAKGISTVADLLLHAPRRYVDRSRRMAIGALREGVEATVIGRVGRVSLRRSRRGIAVVEAVVSDGRGTLTAVWFNQEYQARRLRRGAQVALSGKVERYRGRLQINSPAVAVLATERENLAVGRVVPIHPAIGEASSYHLRQGIDNALKRSRPILDPLPERIRARRSLIERDRAISAIHFPDSMSEIGPARRRLVFDEFFRLQVALAMAKRRKLETSTGIAHRTDAESGLVERFVAGLPYALTGAQRRVIDEIAADLGDPHPMHRLLQGEVGAGKTAVAVAAVLFGVQGGYQAAVMAPTEVLAEQHYEGITRLLADAGMAPRMEEPMSLLQAVETVPEAPGGPTIRVGLLSGDRAEANFRRTGRAAREALLGWISGGYIDIVIGTHALIQEGLRFSRLGVAVVDEQHRFGVHQRVKLKDKAEGVDPDLLIMTATPIPRTLSMTLYGDLDVSELDEMPPGRQPVKTWATSETGPGLEKVHREIRREVGKGRQAFVVCPLVEASNRVEAASAVAEHRRLAAALPELRIGLLHGQMRSAQKEAVMADFRSGELDVLVATTVIEVGIDVPNATIIVIRDADRFGLSQLHQLRGRVGRGSDPAQCVLLADPTTNDGAQRLDAMVNISDGFRLAEEDLRIRGHGTVFGARQSGFSDLRIADILRDRRELRMAREEAFALVDADPDLEHHPEVEEEVKLFLGEAVEWLFRS